MADSPRSFAYTAVFGALWGLVEISLGSLLHAFNIPLKGSFLTALTALVALTGRFFIPERGTILQMGLIAAFIKIFSFGGTIALPILGILAEALILEGTLIFFGNTRFSYFLAGGLAVLWTPIHFLFINGVLFTGKFRLYYHLLVGILSRITGIERHKSAILFVVLGLFLFALGGTSGALSWRLGKEIKRRLLS